MCWRLVLFCWRLGLLLLTGCGLRPATPHHRGLGGGQAPVGKPLPPALHRMAPAKLAELQPGQAVCTLTAHWGAGPPQSWRCTVASVGVAAALCPAPQPQTCCFAAFYPFHSIHLSVSVCFAIGQIQHLMYFFVDWWEVICWRLKVQSNPPGVGKQLNGRHIM